MLPILLTNYVFADSISNIQIEKLSIAPKIYNSLNYQNSQNDGFIWSINDVYNKTNWEQSVSKILKNGTIISFGNIPHPDIKSLEKSNSIVLATNSKGTALISYLFFNEKNQYQRVFYVLKNKSWTRLTDFTVSDTALNLNKIYLDDNENAYFSTSNYKYYSLINSAWIVMDNPANDSQTDISSEKVFSISNNAIYTTRINNKDVSNNTKNSFQIFKYNSNSVDYSNTLPLGEQEYSPACTTMINNNIAIVAYLNNHQNLTKQLIRFDAVKLNNNIPYPFPSKVNNNSLFGAIASLGKSISNLASTDKSSNSNENNEQPITLGELDLNQFAYGYDVANVASRITCATVDNTGYFILKTYAKYPDPQYVYFKVKSSTL
jgi:hypothetical protein